jgi:hypothetical protein
MSSFTEAKALAEKWVELRSDGKAELIREATIAKPYGWVFFWQSSAALREPENVSLQLVGNAPFVVFRDSLELKVLGTAYSIDHFLTELEAKIPPASLMRRPEPPLW